MRVLLSTIGSRGDVQPLMALALQLRELGQEVRICAPPDFSEWIGTLGIPFVPVGPEGSSARGYRADVLIIDEASRIPDASFPAFLPSVAAVPDPKIVMCTTPRAMSGFVWNASRTPTWRVLTTTYEPAVAAGLITQAYIDEQRAILPEDAFRMEFCAEFVDESVSAFPFALLDAAEDETLELEDY